MRRARALVCTLGILSLAGCALTDPSPLSNTVDQVAYAYMVSINDGVPLNANEFLQ